MKTTSKLFRTIVSCAAFLVATTAFISCANGTSTTGSDTTAVAPAATDTMTSPSADTSKMPMDTTHKDSM